MPVHTLTYFAIPGRAEITRMCFYHTNKELKNELISFDEFPSKQDEGAYPLNQLPVFQVDNCGYICQSGAIARYAAKINGLYPEDPLKALYVDEIYETLDSLITATESYRFASDEEREEIKKSFLNREMIRFENLMKLRVSEDSPFIANKEFSLADIAAYCVIDAYLIQFVQFTKEQLGVVSPTTIAYLDKLEEQDVMKSIIAKSKAYLESVSE